MSLDVFLVSCAVCAQSAGERWYFVALIFDMMGKMTFLLIVAMTYGAVETAAMLVVASCNKGLVVLLLISYGTGV